MNFTRPPLDPDKYDLQQVTEHELDEVLGCSSDIPVPTISPIDLFRYTTNLVRTYTSPGTVMMPIFPWMAPTCSRGSTCIPGVTTVTGIVIATTGWRASLAIFHKYRMLTAVLAMLWTSASMNGPCWMSWAGRSQPLLRTEHCASPDDFIPQSSEPVYAFTGRTPPLRIYVAVKTPTSLAPPHGSLPQPAAPIRH